MPHSPPAFADAVPFSVPTDQQFVEPPMLAADDAFPTRSTIPIETWNNLRETEQLLQQIENLSHPPRLVYPETQ